jgi:putative alpha-1,2-mannosidase
MGAWYIQNALGLYGLSPASGNYVLGAPLFAEVDITIDGAAGPLKVVAVNQGPGNVHVESVSWNGAPVNGVNVAYKDLMKGGTLTFVMTA